MKEALFWLCGYWKNFW